MALTITLYDWKYEQQGQVASYESAQVEWIHLEAGTGELVLGEDSQFLPLMLTANTVPILVRVTVNDVPWVGRVVDVEFERKGKPGTGTVTCSLVHELIWWKYMLASQNGSNSSVLGLPQYDTRTGPVATVAAAFINAAADRLGVPVTAYAPIDDTSATVTMQGRFPTTLADLLSPALASHGIRVTTDVITSRAKIPPDQPQPAIFPTVAFFLSQAASDPGLRWSDRASLAELHVKLTAPTGYRAVVGLGGEGVAAQYDQITDDAPGGSGGVYALPEIYTDASGSVVGDLDQARTDLAGHRGSVSASFTVEDGKPYILGKDYQAGDAAVINVAGQDFLDQVTRVLVKRDKSEGLTISPTLGDLSLGDNASVLVLRALSNLKSQVRLLQAR